MVCFSSFCNYLTTKARQEGRKEGRQEGRREGGREKGKKRREQGRKKGKMEGREEGEEENLILLLLLKLAGGPTQLQRQIPGDLEIRLPQGFHDMEET